MAYIVPCGPCQNSGHVCTPAQDDRVTVKPSEFGKPQAGLNREQQQPVIATPDPSCSIGCSKERFDLRSCQEVNQFFIVSLSGYCEHALDQSAVRGFLEGRKSEERTEKVRRGGSIRFMNARTNSL